MRLRKIDRERVPIIIIGSFGLWGVAAILILAPLRGQIFGSASAMTEFLIPNVLMRYTAN